MVVRELIALLGIQIDDKGVKQADNALSRLEKNVQRTWGFLAGSLVVAGVARLTTGMVKLASDASETMNVINSVFGANAQNVVDWSRTAGAAMGRSEVGMRALAAQLGAILNPLMDGNTEAAAAMSTRLSELAVDLSSFFNISEDEALVKLKSGIVGETEAVKSLGVVMTEENLQRFARNEGIAKQIKQLSIAEKTELRYRFILANTVTSHGDAAKTANEYANATRALKDALRDLGTTIGTKLLPGAKRAVAWMRDAVRGLMDVARNTYLFEAAMRVATAALTAFGISAAWASRAAIGAFLKMLVPLALPAAGIAFLILLIDDLHALFTGGKSVIGHYLDKFFGFGTANSFVQISLELVRDMVEWWDKATNAISDYLSMIPHIGTAFRIMFGGVTDYFADMVNGWIASLRPIAALLSRAGIQLTLPSALPNNAENMARGDMVREQQEAAQRKRDEQAAELAPWQQSGGMAGEYQALAGGAMLMRDNPSAHEFGRAAPGTVGRREAFMPTPNRSTHVNQRVQANITVNARGGDAKEIGRETEGGMGRALRDAKEAFTEEVE